GGRPHRTRRDRHRSDHDRRTIQDRGRSRGEGLDPPRLAGRDASAARHPSMSLVTALRLGVAIGASALLSCGATGATGAGRTAAAPGRGRERWVMGYYVAYERSQLPPESIDWTGLTHLVIARVVPSDGGTLSTTFDIDATNGPILARTLARLAHVHGK